MDAEAADELPVRADDRTEAASSAAVSGRKRRREKAAGLAEAQTLLSSALSCARVTVHDFQKLAWQAVMHGSPAVMDESSTEQRHIQCKQCRHLVPSALGQSPFETTRHLLQQEWWLLMLELVHPTPRDDHISTQQKTYIQTSQAAFAPMKSAETQRMLQAPRSRATAAYTLFSILDRSKIQYSRGTLHR